MVSLPFGQRVSPVRGSQSAAIKHAIAVLAVLILVALPVVVVVVRVECDILTVSVSHCYLARLETQGSVLPHNAQR